MNSIISWIGGKKALRELIYERIPPSYSRYVEVFGGGGWVLFGKPPDQMEVYNDYNSNLTNLFRCVRDRPMAFLKELGFLPLNGREEFDFLKQYLSREPLQSSWLKEETEIARHYFSDLEYQELEPLLRKNNTVDEVKKAVAFYKLIRYSYGSGCTSYGCQPCDIRKMLELVWCGSLRLKNTVIENKDFEALIHQYDRTDAFFYCDPPYYQTEGHYEVEFRKEDHFRLRDTLKEAQGKWLVSYNDCGFIRELYQGFRIETVKRPNNLAQRYRNGDEYEELFISNYDTTERVRKMPRQIGLFDDGGYRGMWES